MCNQMSPSTQVTGKATNQVPVCHYTFVVEPPKSVDLTNVSFDEFVAFHFDHDTDHSIPPESEKYDPWYFHVEVEFDAENVGAYYVQMFEQPEFLLTRFTKAQLEEGFWAIQGPNLNSSVSRIIEDSDLPLPIRAECIRSMRGYDRILGQEVSFGPNGEPAE